MFRRIIADKDAYITNKVLNNSVKNLSNVGKAGTLDLFKIYDEDTAGEAPSGYGNEDHEPTREISRILIHFPLEKLKNAVSNSTINMDDDSFKVILKLKDVRSGMTMPENFTLECVPLYKRFDEGRGVDTSTLTDLDVANFANAYFDSSENANVAWEIPGASKSGSPNALDFDQELDVLDSVFADGEEIDLTSEVLLLKGTEDAEFDVTAAIKQMVLENIPDYGFRIRFTYTEEEDDKTRFIKRFGSSQAHLPHVHPSLTVFYDNSFRDDRNDLYFDIENRLYLTNYVRNELTNFKDSDGDDILASSLVLNIKNADETFDETYSVTKSSDGLYYADFNISSRLVSLKNDIKNGKLKLREVWRLSSDEDEVFHSGTLTLYKRKSRDAINYSASLKASMLNGKKEFSTEKYNFQVFLSDLNQPLFPSRIPQKRQTLAPKNCFYRLRDLASGEIIADFDQINSSTKVSINSDSLNFDIYMDDLYESIYSIDLLVDLYGSEIILDDVYKFTKKEY